MTVLLVVNPASGSFDAEVVERAEQELSAIGAVSRFTASSADAFADELRATASSFELIVVAGGDGSLSHAVNALADRRDAITFGLLPMGTGNDLATTLKLPLDADEAAAALRDGSDVELDLGVVSGGSTRRFFVNACVGGFSVDVDEALEEETKRKLGRLAFWLGGLRAATDIERYRVRVDEQELDDVVVVGIGNGRTVGGGLELWPRAAPDDGELDVCAISAPDLAAGVRAVVQVKRGTLEGAEGVTMSRGRRLEVDAVPPMEMNVDGELIGLHTPLVFKVDGTFRLRVPERQSSTE
jgi:diacylglycerol kinase (ATP)